MLAALIASGMVSGIAMLVINELINSRQESDPFKDIVEHILKCEESEDEEPEDEYRIIEGKKYRISNDFYFRIYEFDSLGLELELYEFYGEYVKSKEIPKVNVDKDIYLSGFKTYYDTHSKIDYKSEEEIRTLEGEKLRLNREIKKINDMIQEVPPFSYEYIPYIPYMPYQPYEPYRHSQTQPFCTYTVYPSYIGYTGRRW